MGKGLINQIHKHTPGMEVSVTYSRNLEKALDCYKIAGIEKYKIVESQAELQDALNMGISAISQDIELLIYSDALDLLVGHDRFDGVFH